MAFTEDVEKLIPGVGKLLKDVAANTPNANVRRVVQGALFQMAQSNKSGSGKVGHGDL